MSFRWPTAVTICMRGPSRSMDTSRNPDRRLTADGLNRRRSPVTRDGEAPCSGASWCLPIFRGTISWQGSVPGIVAPGLRGTGRVKSQTQGVQQVVGQGRETDRHRRVGRHLGGCESRQEIRGCPAVVGQAVERGGTDSLGVGLRPVQSEPLNQLIGLHCTQQAEYVEGVLAANPIGSAEQGVARALFQLDHLRGNQSGWTRDRDGVGPLALRFQGAEFSGGVVDQCWFQSWGDAHDSLCMRGNQAALAPPFDRLLWCGTTMRSTATWPCPSQLPG